MLPWAIREDLFVITRRIHETIFHHILFDSVELLLVYVFKINLMYSWIFTDPNHSGQLEEHFSIVLFQLFYISVTH